MPWMIKVAVLYPNKAGMKFDAGYYFEQHIPMCERVLAPALKKITVEQGLSGGLPGSSAAYAYITNLYFESVGAFLAAMAPVAGQIQGDVVNYTDVEPVVQVNEVKLG